MTDRINDLVSAVDGHNLASYHVPTFWECFWSKAGFRYRIGIEPPGSELLQGWLQTRMNLHFSFSDRLRLLFSGHLRVTSTVYMDTPSPNKCMSSMDWHIIGPTQR